MKTAISIPDKLFVSADKLAKNLNIPRSRLFTIALEELLEKYSEQRIKTLLDSIYDTEDSTLEKGFWVAESGVLQDESSAW